MRPLFLTMLVAVIALSPAMAEDAHLGVVFSEARPISFTGFEARDMLSVQVIGGEDCISAVVTYTIRRAGDGFPVFVKSAPIGIGDPKSFPEYRGYYERCAPQAAVSEQFWEDQRGAIVDDRMTFIPAEMREGLTVHVSAAEWNEALGAQLLCLPEGYETTNCYWYDTGRGGARLFLSYGL